MPTSAAPSNGTVEPLAAHAAESAARPPAQSLRAALLDDATSSVFRWFYRPLLVVQLGLYVRGIALYALDPAFAVVGGEFDPQLHENHIGNYSILNGQPNRYLLGVHMGMALFWIAAVLFQKHAVRSMSSALEGAASGLPDSAGYRRHRIAHAVVGTLLCAVAFAGCIAGPLIAWQSHGHPPMRTFLLCLPLFFLPAITTVWVTGRRGARAVQRHRKWANTAFVAPAIASLWAEAMIYAFGRLSALGPRRGELVGTSLAWMLVLAVVVIPTWRRRLAAPRAYPS
jgi:hypothetical protein